jgi:hypothetical protein
MSEMSEIMYVRFSFLRSDLAHCKDWLKWWSRHFSISTFRRLFAAFLPVGLPRRWPMNHGPHSVFPVDGWSAQVRVRSMRAALPGNHRVRSLPSYEQFLVMAFAQLTYRESLRDIQTCLGAVGSKLYHSGIRQAPARSTLADANEKKDWRLFADFARELIAQASVLYADEPFGVELKRTACALDSTTIDLCLSLFPWAKFRRTKAAIKLHTLLALRGNYPTVVIVTTGRVYDVNILDQLAFEPGSFYIFDRGYLDFASVQVSEFAKRTHALGAPVQSSGFKVQSFPNLRNEANGYFMHVFT